MGSRAPSHPPRPLLDGLWSRPTSTEVAWAYPGSADSWDCSDTLPSSDPAHTSQAIPQSHWTRGNVVLSGSSFPEQTTVPETVGSQHLDPLSSVRSSLPLHSAPSCEEPPRWVALFIHGVTERATELSQSSAAGCLAVDSFVHPSEPHFLTFTIGVTYTGKSWHVLGSQ